ncbi:MAG: hypothetical protein LUQ07_03880 [Methanospirillum sp.]|nr:hypothetical protein [Methanospirillum sp.]
MSGHEYSCSGMYPSYDDTGLHIGFGSFHLIYRQAEATGEVRILSGNNLTSKVIYDVSMPGAILFETVWHTLLILILVTLAAFLVSNRLFDDLIVRRLQTIISGLQHNGNGH